MYKRPFSVLFKIDESMEKFLVSSLGTKHSHELYVRFFFRMICYSNDSFNFKEKLQWLTSSMKNQSQEKISRQLILIFGPLIANYNTINSWPYLAWWDLTDSSFVENGLEDLGVTFHCLYTYHYDYNWSKEGEQRK